MGSSKSEFDYVVLAIGSGPGATTEFADKKKTNVVDALDFLLKSKLENKKFFSSKDKVAVIGGGNSAIDAARTALRQGAKVTIIYRRTESEMPALKTEVEAAKKEGVEFEFLKAPTECIPSNKESKLVCSEMILGEKDSSGRKKPVDSGKKWSSMFNKIILAIGQQPDFGWLEKEGVKTNGKVILVNENNLTSLEKVYACGDCITGAATIAQATLTGVKTAQAIISSQKNSK